MSVEQLSHTGDLALRITAPTVSLLFQEGARGVRELLVDQSAVRPLERRALVLGGENEGDRFFEFLRELLFVYDTERFLVATVVTAELGSSLAVVGEPFDPLRHQSERQLKAVTRHGYLFENRGGEWVVEVVFDV